VNGVATRELGGVQVRLEDGDEIRIAAAAPGG
jgi:hypothetical protein